MISTHILWKSGQWYLVANLAGNVVNDDVRQWQQNLQEALDSMPEQSHFCFIIDLHEFRPEDHTVNHLLKKVLSDFLLPFGYNPLDLTYPDTPDGISRDYQGHYCEAVTYIESKRQDVYREVIEKFASVLPAAPLSFDWRLQ